ncbi:transglycosylase [Erwinia phage vB_EamM_Deimos-Minion]|uniref:Putative lytic transglycosylase n=1 Tax=Erwinia phage vB_EamM_Deimos-Minion TaxID=1815986 RepID=A0A173GEP8_9CAUD|nr:transglycosylase [Erwinia phage vB_EamM_Deimos-Minion]ANH52127.1 putative lytic transglycosylase [Erwinia phage vB_EamM_Deimos-Minion]
MKKINAILHTLVLFALVFVAQSSLVHASTSTGKAAVQFNQAGWDKYKSTLTRASLASGVPVTELVIFTSIESDFKAKARNTAGSNAGGLTQFIPSTWRSMVRTHHKKYGLSKNVSRFNAYANAAMTAEYIKQNRSLLQQALKREITTADVYMAHFLGPGTAIQVLKAKGNRSITSVVKATKGNARLFYNKGRPLTVAQFKANMARKVANHRQVYKPVAVKYAVRYEENQRLDALIAKVNDKPVRVGFSTAYVREM